MDRSKETIMNDKIENEESDSNEAIPSANCIEKEETNAIVKIETVKRNCDGTFSCPICSEKVSRIDSIKRHIKRKHKDIIFDTSDTSDTSNRKCVCLECGERFQQVKDLKFHLSSKHSFKFKIQEINHATKVEFLSWKEEIEMEQCCNFILLSGRQTTQHCKIVQYYKCNRSGSYKRNSKGVRKTKACGTRKIENNCTASLKVTEHTNGKITTEWNSTHYGHVVESGHLNISKTLKNKIIFKLKQGITDDEILDDVKNKYPEHVYLLCCRYLRVNNIKRQALEESKTEGLPSTDECCHNLQVKNTKVHVSKENKGEGSLSGDDLPDPYHSTSNVNGETDFKMLENREKSKNDFEVSKREAEQEVNELLLNIQQCTELDRDALHIALKNIQKVNHMLLDAKKIQKIKGKNNDIDNKKHLLSTKK